MKNVVIHLNTINDIRNFVDMTSHCSYAVDLTDGRYTVNGKSIMGVVSLDKSKALTVNIHVDSDEDCADFVNQLKPFMVD